MTQQRFVVVPSVYLFLVREGKHGAEVLLQMRRGTPYMDGWWACGAAGHVEHRESALQAAVREAREELGIDIEPVDLRPLATLHRTNALNDPHEERIDLFFEVRRWRGEPHIAEPEKAAGLEWWPIDGTPEKLVPHEAQAFEVLACGAPAAVLSRGFEQTLTLVAAVGDNRVIGDGKGMPWHIPADLAHFKKVTTGGTMLMGRTTFESIGRALPGRRSIVITRNREWHADGVTVAHSMAEAMLIAGDTEVFVIGGGDIYRQTIELATRLVITEVDQSPEGSVYFPSINPSLWDEGARVPGDGLTFVTYERRGDR